MQESSTHPSSLPLDDWTQFWFGAAVRSRIDRLRQICGIAFLYFLLSLLPDLNAVAGPEGMLPAQTVRDLTTDFDQFSSYRWSWLMLADNLVLLWVTWLLGVTAAVALALNWRPRVTSVACFIIALAFCHRMPMLTGPFEWLLTTLLLYLCCATDPAVKSWNSGLVLRLFQVHLTAVYLAIGLTQLSAITWWQGDAAWWLMANPESRLLNFTFLGRSIAGTYVVNAITHALVAAALAFPILVWATKKQRGLQRLMAVYWGVIVLLTGWLGYCGLMAAATWYSFAPSEPAE